MDSPRSRGWTRDAVDARHPVAGFPALAGMDPKKSGSRWVRRRIPRARGDGPACDAGHDRLPRDSPRSRGWTRAVGSVGDAGDGFPALAGMDPQRGQDSYNRLGIPRARGDGPATVYSTLRADVDSPRSRGWTVPRPGSLPRGAGFPALAGMDPRRAQVRHCRRGIPRARGDGPHGALSNARNFTDSPRSRGWTVVQRVLAEVVAGFPALAGMDRNPSAGAGVTSWIPRARGDGPLVSLRVPDLIQDSPRSRGWTGDRLADRGHRTGFPALAGMDPVVVEDPQTLHGIPRARGDGPERGSWARLPVPDSPRSRGWTHAVERERLPTLGFPALAGMDLSGDAAREQPDGIPRARGDGPV